METEGQVRSGPAAEGYKPIGQARKYRINTKKIARSLLLLGCLIAGIVAVVCLSGNTVPVVAQIEEPQIPAGGEAEASALPGGVLEGKTIVLDAGHGGFDIGATGASGSHEADLNLKVAEYLKEDLEQEGMQVIMTRSDENAIADTKDGDMAKRRQIIQESGSDLFVSIHMNAETSASISGPVVLFAPGAIQGEKLAKMIQNNLLEELRPESKKVARAENLYVLEDNTQPSVLVECGFISNVQEEALLLQEEYQKKVAKAIAQGCMEFLQS